MASCALLPDVLLPPVLWLHVCPIGDRAPIASSADHGLPGNNGALKNKSCAAQLAEPALQSHDQEPLLQPQALVSHEQKPPASQSCLRLCSVGKVVRP